MDRDARKKVNRLWLFFALVSVVLVWTWSQVMQRQAGSGLVDGENIILLRSEEGCDLAIGPCAAYLRDFAVVASASADGAGVAWRVKLVGDGGPAFPELSLQLLGRQDAAQSLAVRREGDEWRARSPGTVASGSILRVRVRGGEMPLVADFPLVGKR